MCPALSDVISAPHMSQLASYHTQRSVFRTKKLSPRIDVSALVEMMQRNNAPPQVTSDYVKLIPAVEDRLKWAKACLCIDDVIEVTPFWHWPVPILTCMHAGMYRAARCQRAAPLRPLARGVSAGLFVCLFGCLFGCVCVFACTCGCMAVVYLSHLLVLSTTLLCVAYVVTLLLRQAKLNSGTQSRIYGALNNPSIKWRN